MTLSSSLLKSTVVAALGGLLFGFVVPPDLGSRAGVLGALVLAEQACTSELTIATGKTT